MVSAELVNNTIIPTWFGIQILSPDILTRSKRELKTINLVYDSCFGVRSVTEVSIRDTPALYSYIHCQRQDFVRSECYFRVLRHHCTVTYSEWERDRERPCATSETKRALPHTYIHLWVYRFGFGCVRSTAIVVGALIYKRRIWIRRARVTFFVSNTSRRDRKPTRSYRHTNNAGHRSPLSMNVQQQRQNAAREPRRGKL